MKKNIIYIFQLIITGILIGLLVSTFIYISSQTFKLLKAISEASLKIFVIVCIIAVALTSSIVMANKRFVGHMGSGIHKLELYFDEDEDYNPVKYLIFLLINSLTAFFQGFTFGTEAPSIFIGASISKIISKFFKNEDKEIIIASASAGFGVAFLAPFAAFMHMVEEHKKNINIKLILKGILIISVAWITAYLVFKRHPFGFLNIHKLPFKYVYIPIMISFVCTLVASLYRLMHKRVGRFSEYGSFMLILTPILGLGFLILTRLKPLFTGSGELLIEENILDISLIVLFIMLLARLIFMFLSESSYLSGGSVLPLLAIGAIVSNILIIIMDKLGISIFEYRDIIILMGMLTTLGVGASIPFSAFILGIEFTKSIHILWPLFICLIFSIIFKKMINLLYYRNKSNKTIFGDNDTV